MLSFVYFILNVDQECGKVKTTLMKTFLFQKEKLRVAKWRV